MHPLMPSSVRLFRERYPDASVTLEECLRDELLQRLRDERVDVAFMRSVPQDPTGLAVEVLLTEPMVVALPRGHALASRSRRSRLSCMCHTGAPNQRGSGHSATSASFAASSPSNSTEPACKPASGGTKRITVPASPQSIATASAALAASIGETRIESVRRSKRAPREVSAAIINSLSREIIGSISSVGESANAANTNSRLVNDFEPGSLMLAAIGALTVGAAQGSK
jgi:DNA-binding transcriptional LysR family regulator